MSKEGNNMHNHIKTRTPGGEEAFVKMMQEKYGMTEEDYIPEETLVSKITKFFKKLFTSK